MTQCRVGQSMASDYYEHAAECPECNAHEDARKNSAGSPQHVLRTLYRFGDMFYTCSCGWEDFIDSGEPAVLKCPKSEDV